MRIIDSLQALVQAIASMDEVSSIGMSGVFPPVDGDIDLFIYCENVPAPEKRRAIVDSLRDILSDASIPFFTGKNWGIGDRALIDNFETWMMYFTEKEAEETIDATLRGEYPDKVGNYYPIGRCATLLNINVLYDKHGFLASMKSKLSAYPDDLSEKLAKHHIDCLKDIEDLERAVLRSDTLFYHYALDAAIDHFLQALFAINKYYFPSRKRSLNYISGFNIKPRNCEERLANVLEFGGYAEGISDSYKLWEGLVADILSLK